jgi:hypothetical protein
VAVVPLPAPPTIAACAAPLVALALAVNAVECKLGKSAAKSLVTASVERVMRVTAACCSTVRSCLAEECSIATRSVAKSASDTSLVSRVPPPAMSWTSGMPSAITCGTLACMREVRSIRREGTW